MTNSMDSKQTASAQDTMATDKRFDVFLQAQLQQAKPYLPDENFTVRVMASLPVVKKAIGWRERVIVLVPLIVISILVLSQNSLLAFAIKSWVLLSIISLDNLFKILMLASLAALLGASYWFARRCRLF